MVPAASVEPASTKAAPTLPIAASRRRMFVFLRPAIDGPRPALRTDRLAAGLRRDLCRTLVRPSQSPSRLCAEAVADGHQDLLRARGTRPRVVADQPVDSGKSQLAPTEVSWTARRARRLERFLEPPSRCDDVAPSQGETRAVRQDGADVPEVRAPSRAREARLQQPAGRVEIAGRDLEIPEEGFRHA